MNVRDNKVIRNFSIEMTPKEMKQNRLFCGKDADDFIVFCFACANFQPIDSSL